VIIFITVYSSERDTIDYCCIFLCAYRLRSDLKHLEQRRAELVDKLSKESIFEKFLTQVMSASSDFIDIRSIMSRYHTLKQLYEVEFFWILVVLLSHGYRTIFIAFTNNSALGLYEETALRIAHLHSLCPSVRLCALVTYGNSQKVQIWYTCSPQLNRNGSCHFLAKRLSQYHYYGTECQGYEDTKL